MDYAWVAGNEEGIIHVEMIDYGSGGQVHKVVIIAPSLIWSI